jgi:hypothetical protein
MRWKLEAFTVDSLNLHYSLISEIAPIFPISLTLILGLSKALSE